MKGRRIKAVTPWGRAQRTWLCAGSPAAILLVQGISNRGGAGVNWRCLHRKPTRMEQRIPGVPLETQQKPSRWKSPTHSSLSYGENAKRDVSYMDLSKSNDAVAEACLRPSSALGLTSSHALSSPDGMQRKPFSRQTNMLCELHSFDQNINAIETHPSRRYTNSEGNHFSL